MTTANTLAEALPLEIERNEKLIEIYEGIEGGVGVFGAMLISRDVNYAKNAIAEMDTAGMLRAYQTLKNNK